jgi:hypothetical protein
MTVSTGSALILTKIGSINRRTARTVLHGTILLASLVFALINVFAPNSYNNLFLQDTLYLLNASYLVYEGYVPHIDFRWQFGGFESYLTALAFWLFGVSFKALEQGAAFAYLLVVALFYLGLPRRTHLLIIFLLFCLISATLLTRYPFENGVPNLETQSFSMLYNRICWGLAIVMFSSLLLSAEQPLSNRQLFVCAVCTYLIVLTKITFVLLVPLAVVLICWRNSWSGVGRWMAAILAIAALAWLFLGYEPVAYVNAIHDILDTTQDFQGARFGPIAKLAYIVFFNIYVVGALIGAGLFVTVVERGQPRNLWHSTALLTLLALSLGVAVTTGTFLALTTTTPMLAFIAVMIADRALKSDSLHMQTKIVLAAALAALVLAFSGPYMANYLAGVAKQVTRGEQAVFTRGALSGLIIDQPDLNTSPSFRNEAEALDYVQRRSELEGRINWMQDYEQQYLLKDGLDLLDRFPEHKTARVIALYPSIFPFAFQSCPVTSFPLAPGKNSPSIQAMRAIPGDIGVVMVVRNDRANPLLRRFGPSLRQDFVPLGHSRMWDLYVRKGPPSRGCA